MKSFDSIIHNSERLTYTFTEYKVKERQFIETAVEKFLSSIGMEEISNRLCYCIHEQATNACKANTKRIHFVENQLNINDSKDYKTGIGSFKNNLLKKQKHYSLLKKKNNLFIKFQIKRDENYIYLSIINNVPISNEEMERINYRIDLSKKYENMIEALEDITDIQEGAGLGVFSTLMVYKEIGITLKDLNIFCLNNETHSTTRIKYA